MTLEHERVAAAAQVARLEADVDAVVRQSEVELTADDEHDPDGATVAFERAQLLALLRAARGRLAELDAAIARAAAGHYGRCEICGREIPAERLEAVPAARTCVACAKLA